ncbi:DUF3945 domain-containing protein [Pedobacter sp. ISL-68]|uniref:DUF4099 domain-containing protein n=1 Tax=unclassified Pedobacter TaxID=2628915 RepID=UPI001BEAB07F|nr:MULTISPECIES: DUF4099 domain-containing protein [unclassified Pedobacter]MBT2560139.1 DUF3945 domain-containing protein [Pedobacter sp. ISL-64]MBT2589118.1 DUF3945 domain-containing protein [Pedobacter sp. ISL-68]
MIQQIFNEQDLPMEDLEKVGLAKNGKLLLTSGDLQALICGRRTDMMRLENLSSELFEIEKIDAKISLKPNASGNLDLLIHPIYKEADYPNFITYAEAEQLQKGQTANIWKMVRDEGGGKTDVLVEFDTDTNEFIVTDTERILVPDMINNILLTPQQKERYRKGQEVEIADGTVLQYSGADNRGIRSNRLALVASLLIDGGVSYMLYKGLNAVFGKSEEQDDRAKMSKEYQAAIADMKAQWEATGPVSTYAKKDEYTRGYGRSGVSR